MENDYSGQTTDISTKTIHSDITHRKVVIYKHVILLPYTEVRDEVVSKIFGLIYTKSRNSPWTGRGARAANGILEVPMNMLFEI